MENSFLYLQAKYLIENYFNDFQNITIVLPNKRAKLFLHNYFKTLSNKTFFAPKIINIEELIENISEIKIIKSTDLLFEFYNTYLKIEENQAETFEKFSLWANSFIQDINEIDRYLLNDEKLFQYLIDIDHINQWKVNLENTKIAKSTVNLWKKLPLYYKEFQNDLIQKNVGYQGLVYKIAVEKLNQFVNTNQQLHFFLGFNALNNSEQIIFKTLLENKQAEVIFDIDETFINDPYHDAGYFLRKIKSNWKHFNTHPFLNIGNDFKIKKNINIIETPKSIGQAKISGKIIEELITNDPNAINKTAIVLADEKLLIPTLNALPKNVTALNISMGYPAKNNPLQILIYKIFKCLINSKKRNNYYYKELLPILNHNYIERIFDSTSIINFIKTHNISFLTPNFLKDKLKETSNQDTTFIIELLNFNNSPKQQIQLLIEFCLKLKNYFNEHESEDSITLTFLFSIYTELTKINNYVNTFEYINSIEILFNLYNQTINQSEVSFEGEPLTGLQILGILETRNLDFENIIITSLNEGILPGGKSNQTLIPYDVKKEYGIPTYKERDAIFSYHFYRLLQRTKNVYLIYNNSTDGLVSGEESRFVNQLKFEYKHIHNITHTSYNTRISTNENNKIIIKKDDNLKHNLYELCHINGLSPSVINSYIRDPYLFYQNSILKINTTEEVEEELAANTFGTIIHNVLEELYKPYINNFISENDIIDMCEKIDVYTKNSFEKEYKLGEYNKGKNLILFEVAKRNIYNFLQLEKESVNQNKLKILGLEEKFITFLYKKDYPQLPFDIKLKGTIDRIDQCNNIFRIIDYKTGKVEIKNLTLNEIEGITSNIANEKKIQLLIYAILILSDVRFQNQPIELGIFSFKNIKSGLLKLNTNKEVLFISHELLEQFKIELIQLILEILDENKPIIENL